jgi:hypothetical protein
MTVPSSGQSPPAADRDEANRIWQHGLHEDTLYQQRLSSFTLIEAVLLGFFGNAYSKGNSEPFVWYVAILSLCFSALWLFIQYRHWAYLTHVTKRIQQFAPEFKATVGTFPHFWLWRFDTPRLLALAIPALFIVTWTALLGWMLLRPAEETPNSFGISFDRFLISIVIAVIIWFFIRLRKIEKLFLTPTSSGTAPKSVSAPLALRSEIKPTIVVAEKSQEVESSSGN